MPFNGSSIYICHLVPAMMTTKLARPGPNCQLHFRRSQLNFGYVPPPLLSLALNNLRLLFTTEPLAFWPPFPVARQYVSYRKPSVKPSRSERKRLMNNIFLSIVYLVATSRFIFRFPNRWQSCELWNNWWQFGIWMLFDGRDPDPIQSQQWPNHAKKQACCKKFSFGSQ